MGEKNEQTMASLIGREVFQISLGQYRRGTITNHEIKEGFQPVIEVLMKDCFGKHEIVRLPISLVCLTKQMAFEKLTYESEMYRIFADDMAREIENDMQLKNILVNNPYKLEIK